MVNITDDLAQRLAIKIYETITDEDWDDLKTKYRKLWLDLAYDVAEICSDNLECDDDPDEDPDVWGVDYDLMDEEEYEEDI